METPIRGRASGCVSKDEKWFQDCVAELRKQLESLNAERLEKFLEQLDEQPHADNTEPMSDGH